MHRNALVLAVPSRDGLAAVRDAVRSLLGWEDVEHQLRNQDIDPIQAERLRRRLRDARQRVPDMIRQAYSVVVTVNEQNRVHAFKLAASAGPLFPEIKNDDRSRVKETPVDAGALLPDGPYDLWRDGEDARFVKDLAGAFARDPRLPKMLNARILFGNRAARRGTRATGGTAEASRTAPTGLGGGNASMTRRQPIRCWKRYCRKKPNLHHCQSCCSRRMPYPVYGRTVARHFGKSESTFRGDMRLRSPKEGYDETLSIPRCSEAAVDQAVERAVAAGYGMACQRPDLVLEGTCTAKRTGRQRGITASARNDRSTGVPARRFAGRMGKTARRMLRPSCGPCRMREAKRSPGDSFERVSAPP